MSGCVDIAIPIDRPHWLGVSVAASAHSVGQFTLTVPRGCWISTQIFDDVACEFAPASGMGNGINAGCSAELFCACTRIHLWTRFALRLWLRAMLAMETPGWTHS